tara:strand:+ start:303 stop:1112 length:810 start_codon:yes stop_codon:yes gene_type:complete
MWRARKIINDFTILNPGGSLQDVEFYEKPINGGHETKVIFSNIDELEFKKLVVKINAEGGEAKGADTQLNQDTPSQLQENMKLKNIIKNNNLRTKSKLKEAIKKSIKELGLSGDFGGSSKYPKREEETVKLDALRNYPFEHGLNYEETAAHYTITVPNLSGRMNKDGSMDGIDRYSTQLRLNPDFNDNLKDEGWGIWAWIKDFEEKFGDATFKVSMEQFKERQVNYTIEVLENEKYFNQVDMWDKKHKKSNTDTWQKKDNMGNLTDKWS